MIDPIVEEVRKHRMEHTSQFGGDLKAICEDLRAYQIATGLKVVTRPPRRIEERSRMKTRPTI